MKAFRGLSMPLLSLLLAFPVHQALATQFAITMDDPEVTDTPLMNAEEKNQKILAQLRSLNKQAALFVCGMRVDNPRGRALLESWNKAGHLLANHSYSHLYLHGKKISVEQYLDDLWRGHEIVSQYQNFEPVFRFPYLKEGNTAEKRDEVRSWLKRKGYRNGAVTIDASDWYVDQRLTEKLKAGKEADLEAYRQFYIEHLWDRANYYDALAEQYLGRSPKHTLLIHHNLVNALFLKDVVDYFESRGWELVDAGEAFEDPLYKVEPDILPAGESLIWAIAKEQGDASLRYPAEDGQYLEADMDRLGL